MKKAIENPVRVLTVITVPMKLDGPTMSALRYARAMDGRVRMDFAAINEPPAEIRAEIAQLGKLHVVGGRLKNPLFYLARLARLIRREKYKIVHARGNSCTLALELLAARLGGAAVRIAHSENSSAKYLAAHRLLRPLFDRLYTDAYACGTAAGEWLFPGRPFQVARISVETEKYRFDPAARTTARAALGVGDARLIGCVANFTPQKNHGFLLDFFTDYRSLNPAAKLVLVGDGALRPEIEAKIAARDMEDSVLLLGAREDVPALLSGFDVMVLPSLHEGFPNVLVEWQCAGLPALVSSRVTPEAKLTELVRFLPIHQPASWVEALSVFYPEDREKGSREAVETVRARGYDIRENARALEAFYLEAARRKENP